MNYFTNFILADSRGNLSLHSMNGEKIRNLKGHNMDISSLKLDIINSLIISSGGEHLYIQNEKGECLREINQRKIITTMEISLHHNLILSSDSDKICMWDYEILKLLGEIDCEGDVSCLGFANYYSAFLIGTNQDKIFVFSFVITD